MDAAAESLGLRPGMTLAHARALVPYAEYAPTDPIGDTEALVRLAEWAMRYSPWVAVDGDDGLVLDISGCAHLFGGEAAMIAGMVERLARVHITAVAAVADTPAAAWAWARYGPKDNLPDGAVVVPGETRNTLASLPVAALRLPDLVEDLENLGLHTIGDVLELPRAPLAHRFGSDLCCRLDEVLGRLDAPISPLRLPPAWRTRLRFPEPIIHRDGVEIALGRLVDQLCALLRKADQGARTVTLTLNRVDCTAQHIAIGTSRAVRDPRHLVRLFAEHLDTVDAGFGIEDAILSASHVEPLMEIQGTITSLSEGETTMDRGAQERLAALIDRLENRFGIRRVRRLAAVESHIPEQAVIAVPVRRRVPSASWMNQDRRPLTLLPSPESIVALAPVPDDPPLSFTWRRVVHRVARAQGPERIDPEWWRQAQSLPDRKLCRDYYRIEDADGRRFWIFREGLYGLALEPRWFMHGLFP